MSEHTEEKTTFSAPKGLVVVHSLGMTIGGIWALLAGCALLGIGIIAIVYVVPKLEKFTEAVFCTVVPLLFSGISFCLWIFLSISGLKIAYVLWHFLGLTVSVSGKGVEFIGRHKTYTVPMDDIVHVLDNNEAIIIIWKTESNLQTFHFVRNLFGTRIYKELKTLFQQSQVYTMDKSEIEYIRKTNGLKNVFRKNRLEYLLPKIT